MRRLVLVRHGESVYNAEGRIQGQRCAGLSEVGHRQAMLTATALAVAFPEADLISSDLQRAQETIAPLARELDRTARVEPRLRERSFGAWEGWHRDEVAERDPDRWARWATGEDVVGEVGGESSLELAERVGSILTELLEGTPEGGVTIAVTHGGTIWHGLHHILGIAKGVLGGVNNASVTELVARDTSLQHGHSTAILQRWNELAHLPVDLRTTWSGRSARSATTPVQEPPAIGGAATSSTPRTR